jgi:hypothetical protein
MVNRSIERVVPQHSSTGIELYVSHDGRSCGISQSALARMCGVSEGSLRVLLSDAIKMAKIMGEPILKDQIYVEGLSSNQNAKVVQSHVACKVVYYFAVLSDHKNETAAFSLGKFTEIGIDNWIKSATGYREPSSGLSFESALEQMQRQINAQTEKMENMGNMLGAAKGYITASSQLPGMKSWMETLTDLDQKRMLSSGDDENLVTLSEWAEGQNIELTSSQIHTLANLISNTYKVLAWKIPPKVSRKSQEGKRMAPAQGYPTWVFPLISICYDRLDP